MSISASPVPGALASELRVALSQASDEQLRRVVGVLDSLVTRGEADRLLAGLRDRIRALHPDRPLRFGRLLVLPLEAALVQTDDWLKDPAGIPRAALNPLIETVRRAMGQEAEVIEMAMLGRKLQDAEAVRSLGRRLWARAATVSLPALPDGWAEAGLPGSMAPPVVALCRALWMEAAD
ncbi:hypothetical protein [Falsiroseomonas sp. HW251]|uniref:hypothetical protein n=1 Tax=Falsiroseomonas sp. HW251 TaxID=3390998 RepID=UPI003D31A8E4